MPSFDARSKFCRLVVMTSAVACYLAAGLGTLGDDCRAAESRYGLQWFEEAATAGDVEAQFRFAQLLERGIAGAADPVSAFGWYHRAAEQGHARAQLKVALGYQQGLAGVQNYEAAILWYQRAARQGVAQASHNLAVIYERGLGVAVDSSKAAEFYLTALRGGLSVSALNLGLMYWQGRGSEGVDLLEALAWLTYAASANVDGAESARAALSAELSLQERRAALDRAAEIALE